jgi:hypothetical protein
MKKVVYFALLCFVFNIGVIYSQPVLPKNIKIDLPPYEENLKIIPSGESLENLVTWCFK